MTTRIRRICLYQGYVEKLDADIYGEKLIELPSPRFVVFYNGTAADVPAQLQLRLTEAFKPEKHNTLPCLECTATVLNINEGHNRELMERCRPLYEYAWFIGRIRIYTAQKLELKEALQRAIEDSMEAGILSEVLKKHRAEVEDLLLTEYDEEKHLRNVRKSGWEEGRRNGMEEGRRNGMEEGRGIGEAKINLLIQKLLADNRFAELERVVRDSEYREKILKEYGIE